METKDGLGRWAIPTPEALTAPLAGLTRHARELCAMLDNAEIERQTFLEEATSFVAKTIGCSRVGIWIFMDTTAGRLMRCVAMYDAVADRMTHAPDEVENVATYFDTLEHSGFVLANDAQTHPATAGFFGKSLAVNGVRSLLAVSVAINGSLYGAFTCTQVGQQVEWTPGQLALLRRISPPLSIALHKASRFTANTGHSPLV